MVDPASVTPAPALQVTPAAATAGGERSASPPAARQPLGPGSLALRLEAVTSQLDQPVFVTHAGDGSGRLFILEKKGQILVLPAGSSTPRAFLDLTPLVDSGDTEQGLLSLVFHPRYASNGLLYVSYSDLANRVVVASYRVSVTNPDLADPSSAVTLLLVEKVKERHNGGQLAFGPDGYLYVGVGDGGQEGDPSNNAQNTSLLLGKLLRLDVESRSPYAIPGDNPFVGQPNVRSEIWAYGLRNPWRFSFDRATGDLYIADPGDKSWEEINVQSAGARGGQNYGWNRLEGTHCYRQERRCEPTAFVAPVAEYDHKRGCAIIGGYVYRGQASPQLAGLYFFGDYCTGRIWALEKSEPGTWHSEELLDTDLLITSFGEDEAGELYLTSLSDNALYRLSAAR